MPSDKVGLLDDSMWANEDLVAINVLVGFTMPIRPTIYNAPDFLPKAELMRQQYRDRGVFFGDEVT